MKEIKEYRKTRGMSQAELAKHVGVERSTVAKWESGSNHPQAAHLVKLAEIFGCSVDELLGRGK